MSAKRLISSLLTLCMVVSLIPAPTFAKPAGTEVGEVASDQAGATSGEAVAKDDAAKQEPEQGSSSSSEPTPAAQIPDVADSVDRQDDPLREEGLASEVPSMALVAQSDPAPIATGVLPTRGYQDPTCSWTLDQAGNLTIYPTNGVSGTFFMWYEKPFEGYANQITSVTFAEGTHTTSLLRLFEKLENLKTADLSKLDSSECTHMEAVFMDCHSLESVNLQGVNTSKVTDMDGLFARCYNLKSVDLSGFDTSNVTSMYCMFADCRSLTEINVSNFNTSKVTDMCIMFSGCAGLVTLDVSNFNTSSVQRFTSMFSGCSALQSVNISGMDLSNAGTDPYNPGYYTGGMFGGCNNLREVIAGNDVDINTVLGTKINDVIVVNPADVSSTKVRIATVSVGGMDGWVYDGAEHGVEPVLTYNGQALVPGRDYAVSGNASAKDAGAYEITIEGKGTFEGSMRWPYTVSKRPVTITADNKSKVVGEMDPTLTATVDNAVEGEAPKYGIYREGGNDVGEYRIIVSSSNNVANKNYNITCVRGTFTILPSQANKTSISGGTINGLESWIYDGTAHTQSPTLTLNGVQLNEGTDFDFEGPLSAKDADFYTVVARGKGNYEGTVVLGYRVYRKSASVKADNKTKRFGEPEPLLTATITGVFAGDKVEYTLSREAGDSVGTYAITASGQTEQGNYDVRYEPGTFTILESSSQPRVSVSELSVMAIADQTYTGQGITPQPLVSYGGTVLVLGRDYSLSYASNVEVGTATITLEGMGGFEGTRTLSFNIVPIAQDPTTQGSVLNELRADYANARSNAASAAGTVTTREAEVAQAQRAYDELLSQNNQQERAKAVQDALDELNAAKASLEQAKAAYNDATAAIQQNESQITELENGMLALNNAVGDAQQGVTLAQQGVTTAQQERDAAAADVAAKQQAFGAAVANAQVEVAKGSVGFFQSVGNNRAAGYLTDTTTTAADGKYFADCTNIGGQYDATSLQNMLDALDWIDYCNQIRAERVPPLPALKVCDELMSAAQRNANYSTTVYQHARTFAEFPSAVHAVAENLYITQIGKVSAYKGWYYDEKENYEYFLGKYPEIANMSSSDAKSYLQDKGEDVGQKQIGHYLSIVNPLYTCTGIGLNSTRGYRGAAIQHFGGYVDTSITPPVTLYTVADYRTRLLNYYDSIAGESIGVTERAALQAAQQTLASKKAALTQANSALSTAQANLQAAQQAVTDAQAQKTALENKRSGLAQAQTNAAAARDNAQATVNLKQQAYDAAVAALNDTAYAAQLAQAQTALEQAQQNLRNANAAKQTADAACAAALAALNEATNIARAQIVGIEDRQYTWDEMAQQNPRAYITVSKGSRSETYELELGKDYTKSLQTAGSGARIVLTGTSSKDSGRFWGSTSASYDLAQVSLEGAEINVSGWTYDGRSHTAVPRVSVGGSMLSPNTDYTIAGNVATNAGSYTLTVTGKGNYVGSKTASFRIERAKVAVPGVANRTYNGSTQVGVAAGAGYALSGTWRATNAGTYTATATSDANHCWPDGSAGARRLTWRIAQAGIGGAAVSAIGTQAYTGRAVCPRPTVRVGGRTLRLGADYTLTYRNNVRAGTATVVVTGRGNYAGTKSVTFRIMAPSVSYRTHVQNVGWQGWRTNGRMSGTSGRGLRLEGINIKLGSMPASGGIQYRTHIQNIGWQGWRANGAMSGTSGRGLRLEAIEIRLTGSMAQLYDVYYRVHAQNVGWMGWAKNGVRSGTAGFGYRLEGIQVVLVPKGAKAPAATYLGIRQASSRPFRQR